MQRVSWKTTYSVVVYLSKLLSSEVSVEWHLEGQLTIQVVSLCILAGKMCCSYTSNDCDYVRLTCDSRYFLLIVISYPRPYLTLS